jgi:DNA-binding NarL/FixJ family response regulator
MVIPSKPSILLIDANFLFREALEMYLIGTERFAVSHCSLLSEAAAQIALHGAFSLVLFSLQTPDAAGLSSVPRVVRLVHPAKLVVVSDINDPELGLSITSLGASGHFDKSMSINSLLPAIDFVLSGEIYLRNHPGPQRRADTPWVAELDDREIFILRGLCEGKKIKAIALDINLREYRIHAMLRLIYRKMGVEGRVSAAIKAASSGLF